MFSCRRFDRIQSDTSSRQADRVDRSWSAETATRALYLHIVSLQVGVKTIFLDEVVKPAVYKMNSRGPRTDPCGTSNRMIFCVDRAEPCRTHSTLFDRYDWNQSSAAPLDTEGDLEPCQQDVVVDGIKCCRQVEQGEDRQVAVIDCIQNVRQYFQHGHLSRVMCPICGLQAWQKVCRGQVAVELLENETEDRLSRNLAS